MTKHQFGIITPQMVRKFCKEHNTSAWIMFNQAFNDHADNWDEETRVIRDFVRFQSDGFVVYYVRKYMEEHND